MTRLPEGTGMVELAESNLGHALNTWDAQNSISTGLAVATAARKLLAELAEDRRLRLGDRS